MFDKLKPSSIVYAVEVTIAAILGFLLSGVTQGLEHWSSDLQMAYLSDRKPSQYPRIALILINDKTLENYSYTSPIDRQLIADLVDRLDASGAKVIGLDFIVCRQNISDSLQVNLRDDLGSSNLKFHAAIVC